MRDQTWREAPSAPNLRRRLNRLHPVRAPLYFPIQDLTRPTPPSPEPVFYCYPFLNTPKVSPRVRSSRYTAPGPRESTSPRASAGTAAHPRPHYSRLPPTHPPTHPALQRDSQSPDPPPPLHLPDTPPSPPQTRSWPGVHSPRRPLPPALGTGSGRPTTPRRQAVCPSGCSQFPDPFASPS